MRARSLFLGGNFRGIPGQGVRPITLAVNSYDIPKNELKDVLKQALPNGWTGTSPRVVKTLDGEYLVSADGTAQFVPLGRAPEERFHLGGSMFGRAFLGQRQPLRSVPIRSNRMGAVELIELGASKRLGQLTCCQAPDGNGYCFDTGTGECSLTWIGTAPPGSPACIKSAQGEWVHPSCVGEVPTEAPGRPILPPGCRYVAAPDNPMQEVICECYRCDTGESNSWRGFLSDFIAMGSVNPCLESDKWVPKPATCPIPGQEPTETPVEAPPPPPTETPTEAPTEAPGPEPTPSEEVACPDGDRYDLFDTATGELLAADVAQEDLPEGVEVVAAEDPRCGVSAGAPAAPGGIPTAPGLPGAPGSTPWAIPSGPMAPGGPMAPSGPVPVRGGQSPFPQTFYPCGSPSYFVQDLSRVTKEQSSPTEFEPNWRRVR